MINVGRLIVIEGTDGSGKKEQLKKLVARLKKEGVSVREFDFPRYEKPSSYFVTRYLRGDYGTLEEVGPQKASLFYALDRFDVSTFMKRALTKGYVLVSNRYVASNMGHQGSKIRNSRERRDFFRWVEKIEYNILGIPRPEINILLHVPAAVGYKLVEKKGKRAYLGKSRRDIHEIDIEHLKAAEESYLELARTFPDEFQVIECFEEERLLSINEIHERVWRVVQKLV